VHVHAYFTFSRLTHCSVWCFFLWLTLLLLLLLLGHIAALARCGLLLQDGVAWSVSLSVGWSVCLEPCKNSLTDLDVIWGVDFGGRKELCIRWGSRSPRVKLQFWGRNGAISGHAWTCLAVDIYSNRLSREAALVLCWCRLGCTRWGAHWRHLWNTTESSVCGGLVAIQPYVKLLWPLVISVITVAGAGYAQ